MVEFALVSLPLFLILFGILDFGRALNYYNDLTQLTGQGARAAAVNRNPDGTAASANFQTLLANDADSNELRSGIKVCITQVPAAAGDPVTVTATFAFKFIPLVRKVDLNLSASQTMRFEGSSPTFTTGCSS